MSVFLFPLVVDGDPISDYARLPLIGYRNRFRDGQLTATSETADGPHENAITGTTFDFWSPATLPASLTVTLPSGQPCDYCGIAAHTLGSTRTRVFVEYLVGSTWTEAASVLPGDDEPLMMVFPPVTSAGWRIRLSGPATPVIGVAHIGMTLTMQRGIIAPFTPPRMAETVELMTNVSLGGQLVGQSIIREGAEMDIRFAPLDASWVRGDFSTFRQYFNRGGGFFFAWAPGGYFREVSYCWRGAGELRPAYRDDHYMDVSMEVRAYVG